MTDKKQETTAEPKNMADKKDVTLKIEDNKDKPAPTEAPAPTPVTLTVPVFTKNSPNDMYRKFLPGALFLLTFVTVMTLLLIYMDTVALGARQFRQNMTRDYELGRIPQDSAALVAYVRQVHLAPREIEPAPIQPVRTQKVDDIESVLGDKHKGVFVEILPSGPAEATTLYLQSAKQWRGLLVRAAPTAYLALRGHHAALHACLAHAPHPREITYNSATEAGASFPSRVLCLPLYTVLLAADATEADYLVVAGVDADALKDVPMEKVDVKLIEVRSFDQAVLNSTTALLKTRNYEKLAEYEDGIMYQSKRVSKVQ